MGNNKKVTVKVKTEAKKGKPIKAKLSSNKGGILTAKIAAIVNKKQ